MKVVYEKSNELLVDGKRMVYKYRLIESSIRLCVEEGDEKVRSYGIEVERDDYVSDNITEIERETIKLISPYKNKVDELVDVLWKNTVSPIHCIDVIGEDVDECAHDFDRQYLELA